MLRRIEVMPTMVDNSTQTVENPCRKVVKNGKEKILPPEGVSKLFMESKPIFKVITVNSQDRP